MNYITKEFWCLALDPVHIGTGEFQLGRVDNTIVREPGTNLPKIPGSSIAGVARAFTAMAIPSKYLRPSAASHNAWASCAGKGGSDGDDHCGKPDCPVCIAFGFSKKGTSFQGLVQFSDAQLVFFPVASIFGPLWITSPNLLAAAGLLTAEQSDIVAAIVNDGYGCMTNSHKSPQRVKAGWLSLPAKPWPVGIALTLPPPLTLLGDRVAVVSNRIISQIVNDQLEIRTSVSIDPHTGAASGGALFTVEAMPRGTILRSAFHVMDPSFFLVPPNKAVVAVQQHDLCANVWNGLRTIEALGIGGMNTRGFGRMRLTEKEQPR